MSAYCRTAPGREFHDAYHATEYGFPQTDERVLFERQCLEIMQAGLSWNLVLRRRAGMKSALAGYDVEQVSAFGPNDVARLLADPAMIRNRLKVEAVVANAVAIRAMRDSHGGFARWIDEHLDVAADRAAWVKLFRKTFKFMGPEVVGEFLMSLGVLPGAHAEDCPVAAVIARLGNATTRDYVTGHGH